MEEGIRQAVDISTLVIYREFLDLNYFRDFSVPGYFERLSAR